MMSPLSNQYLIAISESFTAEDAENAELSKNKTKQSGARKRLSSEYPPDK